MSIWDRGRGGKPFVEWKLRGNMDYVTGAVIAIPLSLAMVFITRILTKRHDNTGLIAKQLKADYDKLLSSKNAYVEELEEAVQHYKNKASRMERGPKMEGDPAQWTELLPDLLGDFTQFAPKWLKPFLGHKEIQQAMIERVMKEPEKYADYVAKFIGKKSGDSAAQESTQSEAI